MYRIKLQTIGEVIKDFFTEKKGVDFTDEMTIIYSWKDTVGDYTAAHTLDLYIKNGVLFVHVDSDALRNEMNYSKTLLLKNLNRKVGRDLLKEIVFK